MYPDHDQIQAIVQEREAEVHAFLRRKLLLREIQASRAHHTHTHRARNWMGGALIRAGRRMQMGVEDPTHHGNGAPIGA